MNGNSKAISFWYWAVLLGSLAACVFLMWPVSRPAVVYQQTSPTLAGITAESNLNVKLPQQETLAQRIWLPVDGISRITFFAQGKLNQPADLTLSLYEDADNARGDVLATVSGTLFSHDTYTELQFVVPALQQGNRWVWTGLSGTSSKPVLLLREEDGSKYPGGTLVLVPSNRIIPGVLAFTLAKHEWQWRMPTQGVLFFIGLLTIVLFLSPNLLRSTHASVTK